jgi:hypothetical protein
MLLLFERDKRVPSIDGTHSPPIHRSYSDRRSRSAVDSGAAAYSKTLMGSG